MPIFRRSLEDVEGVPYIMDPVGESDHQLQIGTSADGIPIKKYLPTKSFHVRPYSRSKRREQASSMLLGLDIDPSLKLVEQRQKHRHSLTVPLRNLREEEEDWAHFTSAAPSRSLAGPHTSVGYFEDMQVRNTTGSIMEKDSSLPDSEEQVPNSQSKNGGKTITEIYADAHLHAAEPAQLPFEPVVDRAKLMRLYKNKRLLQSCPLLPIVPAAPGKDEMPVVAKSSFFVVHGLKNSAKKQQTGGSVVGINASKEKSKRIIASSDVEKVPLTAAQQRRLSAPTYASRRIFGMNEYKKIVRGQMRIEEAQQEVREVAVESGNSALLRNTVTTAGNSDILHIDGEDLVLPPHRPFSAPSTAHNSDISMVSVSIVTRKGSSIVSQEGSTTFPLTEGKYLGIQDELEVPQHIFIKNRIIYVYIASTPHDFISERAELFGAVFPCLNKMLFSLGVCAIPVDMTFSEAVSSKRSGSMFSKFREIENCSFCVALRGAKYGDARSDESVKCEGNDGGSIEWLSSQHKTASSMELELMYALNCMESTGTGKMLAYFRDLSFLNIMQKEPDDSIREIFLPSGKEEEQAIKQTETLDSRLKKHPYCAPRAYSCSYKKSKNKRSPGRIEKLDQFVESVTNDLFESIRKSVSYFSTTPYEIEQSKQKNFFDIYSEGKAFCFDQKRALAETIENQLGTKPVMILGDPGSGKSSFSAWLHDHFQANDAYVPLTYFSQASVNSTNASNMMRYMLKEIDRVSGSISSPRSYFPNEPYSSLKQSFNHNLERLSMLAQKQGKRIVMIIDGVDNFVLGDGKSATMNDWLPTSLPNNLLMIFSAEKNSNATNWLFDWYKNNVYTVLTEEAMVNQNSRKKVIISVMNQCKVSWKTSIVNTLMKDKQLANPRSIRSYVYMVNQHSQENGQNPKLTKVMKTTPKIIESLHLHFFSSLELSLKSYLISTGYLSAVDLAFDNGGFPAEENLLGRLYLVGESKLVFDHAINTEKQLETVLSKFKIHYHAINGAKNARFQFRKDMLLKYMDNVSIGTHNGHVTCGAFSPSSHKLVTGSSSGEVSVVTYEKNQPPTERHILEGHSSSICKVLFSPKDAYLATAAIDGDIEIWDGTSYEHHKTLKWHTAPVTAMQFSKDLKSLVSGCGSGIVQRWDLATGAYVEFGSEMTKLNNMHKSSVLFVGFSEDEKRILSISKEGDIRIFTSESIDLLKICTTIQTHHLLEMARPCPHQPFKMYALLGSTFVSFSLIDVLDLEQFDGELSVENHISRTKTELYNRTRSNPENALQFPDKDVVALRDHLKVLQSEIEEKRNKSGMKAQTSINVQTVLKCKDKLAVKIFDVLASHGFKDENAVDKILCDRNGKGILVTSSLNDKMSKKSEFKTYGKVTCLGTCPHDPAMVFCGDSLGHVYILSHHTSGEMELDEPDIE
eukprot:g8198.t1